MIMHRKISKLFFVGLMSALLLPAVTQAQTGQTTQSQAYSNSTAQNPRLAAAAAQTQQQTQAQIQQSQANAYNSQTTPQSQAASTMNNAAQQIDPYAPPQTDSQVLQTQLTTYPVFGQSLFQGRFAQQSFVGYNPDYQITVGDVIDLRLWGVEEQELQLTVDPQGNIFVPKVGPVSVVNTPNRDLNKVIGDKVKSIFRDGIGVYATLAAAVPVKVFVSGYVTSPGLYPGFASDSVLSFIDRAAGIAPSSGSYLDVSVIRGGKKVTQVNLYDFMTKGTLPMVQLHDGDSIFVGPIGPTVTVTGLVANQARYEFKPGDTIESVLDIAGVNGQATNLRVIHNSGVKRNVEYVKLGDPVTQEPLKDGDEIEVSADRQVATIAVTLEGEHQGAGQYVLPYNATLADLMAKVQLSPLSQSQFMQLYRVSVAERQKQVLDQMLEKLQQSVLSARSGTTDEAQLRTQEAALVMQFVQHAKQIQPRGQVVLPENVDPSKIVLEDGDVVRIPRASELVAVHGEVYLPNSFVWQKRKSVSDYIQMAGGVIQKSAGDRILLMRPSGEVEFSKRNSFLSRPDVRPGDEIMVMPAVDSKNFQFSKDIIQVMYQVAIAAGVLIRI